MKRARQTPRGERAIKIQHASSGSLSIFRPTKQTLPARISTGDAIFPVRARRLSLEPSILDAIPLSTLITTRNYAILEAGGALKFLMRENAARARFCTFGVLGMQMRQKASSA